MAPTVPLELAELLRQLPSERAQMVLFNWVSRTLPERLCGSTPGLCWQAWPRVSPVRIWQGGSAVLIRTPVRILGVTARHVVDSYLKCKRASSEIEAVMGGLRFDLEERIISRGRRVDIATFRVEESDLQTIGYLPLEDAWPPSIPDQRGLVVCAGCPGHERVVVAGSVTWGVWTGWGNAGLSEHQITIVIDHSQGVRSPIPGVPPPPQHFDVGGISGGPVMTVGPVTSGGSIDWKLGGVIHEGRPEHDQIMAERADIIQDDGRVVG